MSLPTPSSSLSPVIGTPNSAREKSDKPSGGEFPVPQYEKSGGRPLSKGAEKASKGGEQAYDDADKEGLRLANKLLQEEIEDEKVKLEGLQKKLERLKNSGIKLAPEDPDLAKLKRENRRLQNELQRLQEDVRLLEEDVLPYVQKLQKGAGNAPWYRHDQRKSGYPREDKSKGIPK